MLAARVGIFPTAGECKFGGCIYDPDEIRTEEDAGDYLRWRYKQAGRANLIKVIFIIYYESCKTSAKSAQARERQKSETSIAGESQVPQNNLKTLGIVSSFPPGSERTRLAFNVSR